MCVGAMLFAAAGCGPRALDSAAPPPTGGSSNPDDIAAALQVAATSETLLIVGTNGGVLVRTRDGGVRVFERDPDTLVAAAMAVSVPTCSVEFGKLIAPSGGGAPEAVSPEILAIDAALAICDGDDIGEMTSRLTALKTASTVVVIASNTAITVHSTNNGINYFYGADIVRLLRAARKLYVPACVIAPDALGIPIYPEGTSPGLTIEEALARCGR